MLNTRRNTYIYVIIWALASLGGALFVYNIYTSLITKEINITKQMATREVLSANSFCSSILLSTENNLKLISSGQYLKNFINSMQPYQSEDTEPPERIDLMQFLAQLLSANTRYNSIRFISVDGRERIKVINTDTGPQIIPPSELKDISNFSYIKDCLSSAKGSIYYSDIDLQMSDTSIEFPYKPTLRIGTSVYNSQGKLKGMVIINLGIDFSFPSAVSLLNKNGDWVIGGGEHWMGFLFAHIENFATIYPQAWQDISTNEFGYTNSQENIFEFTTLTPPSADNGIYWKIVSMHPTGAAANAARIVDTSPLLFLFILYELVLITIIVVTYNRQTKVLNYQKIIETNLEHYDISLRAGHAMSWLYTPNTHSFSCSKHVEDLLGIPADNYNNEKDFINLFKKSSSESVRDFFDFLNSKNYDDPQSNISIEHRIVLPSANPNAPSKDIWLKTFGIRLKESENSCTIYGISIDITNRVLLEQSSINSRKASEQLSIELQNLLDESERLRIKAEEAGTAKADFLANMSHEIRTPMNSVLGMVSLLQETELTDEQSDYLSAVKFSGEALLMIINDILDHSKIESGMLEISEVPLNICHTIENIIDMIAPQAEEKPVELSYYVDENVPTSLIGDDLRITQVLLNLGGNAVKFTHSGNIHFSVTTKEETDTVATLEIKVKDTGIGISKHALEDIFDKFTQADESTTRKFGGTGLGLTICKSLVELMSGEIHVDSEEGISTTFTIILPLKKPCLFSDKPNAIAFKTNRFDAETTGDVTFSKAKILLCEDNEMNQNLCIKFLKRFDIVPVIAENGLVAIDQFLQGRFDLILMDLQMPELDGISATKEIRNIEFRDKLSPTPIIAVTANVFDDDKQACYDAGMDGFLAKPVSLRDFKETLHAFIPTHLRDISENSITITNDNNTDEAPETAIYFPDNLVDYPVGIANSGGEENFKSMAEVFIEDTPILLDDITKMSNDGKLTDASRHAHTLKSMAGIIGATSLQELSFEAEHSKDIDSLMKLLPTLLKLTNCVLNELRIHLGIDPVRIITTDDKTKTSSEPAEDDKDIIQESTKLIIDKELGEYHSGCYDNFVQMLEIFSEESMLIVQNIELESLDMNTDTTFRHVNTLKGMASIIGATKLQEICIEAEASKDCEVIQAIIPIIRETVQTILQEITTFDEIDLP